MEKLYPQNKASKNWLKALVLGFLFLALGFSSVAQNKKFSFLDATSKKAGTAAQTSRKGAGDKEVSVLRQGTATSKPRNAQEYTWSVNTWLQSSSYVYTYNTAGYLTEEIMSTNGILNSRNTYAYDSRGNLTEYTYYDRGNGAWVVNSGGKNIMTYMNNRLTEVVSQYNNGNGIYANSYRDTYTYDAAGKFTEIVSYEWEDNAWEIDYKGVLQYNAGSMYPHTILYQEMEGNTWVNDSRETDIQVDATNPADQSDWMNWRITRSIEQEWVNNAWLNTDKETTTYSANGSNVLVQEKWENGAWVLDDRYTMTYDDKGIITLDQGEERINNEWVITFGEKYTNTYNATGDLTETIQQNYNTSTNAYVNDTRWVYSSFQTVLSAREDLKTLLQVYPNPALGQLSVKLEKGAGASVKVVSLAGQTMLSTSLSSSNEQEINLASLPAGTYILQIQSKAGVRTQKIVKL